MHGDSIIISDTDLETGKTCKALADRHHSAQRRLRKLNAEPNDSAAKHVAAPLRAYPMRRLAAALLVFMVVAIQIASMRSLGEASRNHVDREVAPGGNDSAMPIASERIPPVVPPALVADGTKERDAVSTQHQRPESGAAFAWEEKHRADPFLCSVTRVRNEHIKFRSFVRHHRREGFDIMLFLDDRSSPPLRSDDPRVKIRPVDFSVLKEQNAKAGKEVVNPYGLSFVNEHLERELMACTWVAYIDVDELVTTRRNESATVREQIERSFANNVDAVHVPWVLFGNDLRGPQRGVEYSDVALEVLWRFNHSIHHVGFDSKTRDRFWEIGASSCSHALRRQRMGHLLSSRDN